MNFHFIHCSSQVGLHGECEPRPRLPICFTLYKPLDKGVSRKFCLENILNAKPTQFSSDIFLKQFLKDTIL